MMVMDSMRILFTENCNANCPSCFNAHFRNGRDMPFDMLEKLSVYLTQNGIKRLKVLGGEPTVHKHYLEAVDIFQKYFQKVYIFTNALNDKILQTKLRESDGIVYNFSFINKSFDIRKLKLDEPGSRSFEVQIPSDADAGDIINRLETVFTLPGAKEKIHISTTMNCMEHIFEKRGEIIPKWNKVVEYLAEKGIKHGTDHPIPLCFYKNTDMDIKPKSGKCPFHLTGAIDASLNLRFCAQHPKVLTNMIEDGELIPFSRMLRHLYYEYENKLCVNYDKKCFQCTWFNKQCNGGCYLHRDIYERLHC